MQPYLRHPTIASDRVAFIAEDDVWVAPVTGGRAHRITTGDGEAHHPALSPDGSRVAYSRRVGVTAEVWVAPVDGGRAHRITWLGGLALVRGWSPDGRICFSCDAEEPFRQSHALYLATPGAGPLERLPWSRVRDIGWSQDGAVVLGRNTADPATWKRDRTGTSGRLWVDRHGEGEFREILGSLAGNLACPMCVGSRVWFVADHEGVGNLYSCRPTGRDVRRHTDHDTFYARWAATDGQRVVYQHAGDVWIVPPDGGQAAPIELDVPVSGHRRRPRVVTAAKGLTDARLSADGERLAVESRGQVTRMGTFRGGAHAITAPGVRHRLPRPVTDTALLVVSDEGGEEHLELVGSDGDPRPVAALEGRVRGLEVAPDGSRCAATTHRGALFTVDLTTGEAHEVDRAPHGWIDDVTWSPDSRWLAYAHATVSDHIRTIRILDVPTGQVHPLTEPRFHDAQPSFDPTGRYLYFLSGRGFEPAIDVMGFELSFPRPVRAFAVALRADVPPPFEPGPADLVDGAPDGRDGVEIEFEGLAGRICPVPVPPGRYSRAIGARQGVLLKADPLEGQQDIGSASADPPAKAALQLVTLGSGEVVTLSETITSVVAGDDRRHVLVRAGSALRRIAVGSEPPGDAEPASVGPATGWIDLDRVRVEVDPPSEWRQMFDEVCRRTAEFYWTPDLAGVDWAAITQQYRPLLERLGSRADLSDLIWELHGELAVSHAYESGGDRGHAIHDDPEVGDLGVDLRWDGRRRGWVVEAVYDGDVWDPGRASPLVGPGRGVRAGEVIRAVDGVGVSAGEPLGKMLAGRVGKEVDVVVGTGSSRRTITTRPLGDDRPARYRSWVERNRELVLAATEGRVGYLHVPNMDGPGFAEFHRGWYAEFDRDALIVDARFNEGGFVSTLVLEKLRRRPIGLARYRWRDDQWYPRQATAGPVVAMANEHTGSDGDLFSHAFRLLDLGPLVGTRTWGGVIGIMQKEPLVDGTAISHPEFAHWFPDVGWELEGTGAQPSHEVENRPQDDAAGIDRQLEKAIALATSALRRTRRLRADGRPLDRSRPELPVRPA
ncbi:MAG TPA: S41 family peptidase [Nitriliruptorales bacterium]